MVQYVLYYSALCYSKLEYVIVCYLVCYSMVYIMVKYGMYHGMIWDAILCYGMAKYDMVWFVNGIYSG